MLLTSLHIIIIQGYITCFVELGSSQEGRAQPTVLSLGGSVAQASLLLLSLQVIMSCGASAHPQKTLRKDSADIHENCLMSVLQNMPHSYPV